MTLFFSHTQKKGKSLFGGALMLLFLSACSLGPSIHHQTYMYHGPKGWTGDHTSGERIVVTWTAQQGPLSDDPQRTKVLLSVELVGGPFRTVNDFLDAVQKSQAAHDSFPPSVILLSSQPIQTNNWTNQSYTSTLTLPQHLKSGYYDLFYTVTTTFSGKPSIITRNDALFRINGPYTSN